MTWARNSNTRHVPYKQQQRCFTRDKRTCQDCGYTSQQPGDIHADHTIQRSQGGSDHLSNLVTLCTRCHDTKTRAERAEREQRRRDSLRLPTEQHPLLATVSKNNTTAHHPH